MAAYTLEFNDAYLIESMKRYRTQSVSRFGRVIVKVICFIGLAFLFGVCVWAKIYTIASLFAFFILLLLVGPRIDYWLMKRQLHKSPFYRQKIRAELQAKGFKQVSELSRVELKWGAFIRAVRIDDGFLLFTSPRQFDWLPDASLVEGDIEEVHSLLQTWVPGLYTKTV